MVYCTFGDETLPVQGRDFEQIIHTIHVRNTLWHVFRSAFIAYPE